MVSVLHTGIVSRKSFSAVRRKSMMVYTRFRCQIAAGDDDAPTSDGLDPSVISQGNVKGPASPRSPAQVGTPSSSAVLPQPHCLLAYTMHHINHTAYIHYIIQHTGSQCVFTCTLSTPADSAVRAKAYPTSTGSYIMRTGNAYLVAR